jgi:vacuolar-type H+-ATPase subunit E/Vma4
MKNDVKELKGKIISDAKKEAESLISRAKKAEQRILIQAKEEEKKIKEEAEKKGKLLFEKEKARMDSKKKMDEKKGFFSLRNKLFGLLRKDLEEKLILMLKDGKLDNWIKSCASEVVDDEKKAVLVAREKDLGSFRKICSGVEGLSFDYEPMLPGFLIRSEENEYDFRFSLLADNMIKQNMRIIAVRLGVTSG